MYNSIIDKWKKLSRKNLARITQKLVAIIIVSFIWGKFTSMKMILTIISVSSDVDDRQINEKF